MSKGPGKWQRAILERVGRGEVVTIPDLLDVDYSNLGVLMHKNITNGDIISADYSQRVAIERAIKTLARRGQVQLARALFDWQDQKAYRNQWAAIPISVIYPFQHLDTQGNNCKIIPARSDADCRRQDKGLIYRQALPAPRSFPILESEVIDAEVQP